MPRGAMNSDRLNGWKEIAAHLGKGVSTAQRWERTYQMPVRRLGREGGEIVWASRSELDEWQRTQPETRRAEQHQPSPEVPASTDIKVEHGPIDRKRRWPSVAVIGGLAAAVATIVNLANANPKPGLPANASVEPGVFRVFDADASPLFEVEIPFLIREEFLAVPPGTPGHWVNFADLDGDGATEVILLAYSPTFHPDMAVHVFGADGSERFKVRPTGSVRFGDRENAGPWRPHRIAIAANGRTGLSLFIAFVGPLEFPSLVIEVDASGTTRGQYWSNGYVQAMHVAEWKGVRTLLVGATNNDSRGASLAVFPNGQLSGSAPASRNQYRCRDCGPGGPSEFYVFPRQRIATTIDGQATAQDIRVSRAGDLHVNVGGGPPDKQGWFPESVWYTIRQNGTINALIPSGVRAYYDRLVREGLLQAPFGPADERVVFPVQRWAGERFENAPTGSIEY